MGKPVGLTQKIEQSGKFNKAIEVHFENNQFLKNEIKRLQDRIRAQQSRIEALTTSCEFYIDKSDTLEKMLIENGLMNRSSL